MHAEAPTAAATDWARIVAWYDVLERAAALAGRCAESGRRGGHARRSPGRAWNSSTRSWPAGELADYHLAHAARADLCRRLGRTADARESYQKALALARQEPERRFLERRLRELG